ncbi:MAG: zinc-binding dehydrogenase, partial [Planctomycetota bacterium]
PPTARPGHALVRTSHLSLCGSDIQMLHHAPDGSYPFPPGTTGHEMVGVIESVGDANGPFHVGDRVLALAPGHQAMCELYAAPLEHVLPLPSSKPIEVLLQAQQLGTVLYAAQRLSNPIGKNVCVIGQGSAGLWFDFQLRRMGARRVVAIDLEGFRLARSHAFGATHAINNALTDPTAALREKFDGELADVVVEAAGEVDSINLAVDLVKQYGEILFFGYPRAQTFPFRFDQFFHKCCRATTIVGAACEPDQTSTRIALELIASGAADGEALITHRMPFDAVIDAYELHRTRSDEAIKIVIEMPGAVS